MKQRVRGFTLLELLLVVGIAAVLIIAGITLYGQINTRNQFNETEKLIHLVLTETRALFPNKAYTLATGSEIETALINMGKIPPKYVRSGGIRTPLGQSGGYGLDISPYTGGFLLIMEIPRQFQPELAARFDPHNSFEITNIQYCGNGINDTSPAPTIAQMSAICLATTGETFTIQSQ